MVVYVEVSTLEDEMIADDSGFQPIKQKLNTFKEGKHYRMEMYTSLLLEKGLKQIALCIGKSVTVMTAILQNKYLSCPINVFNNFW